MSKKVKIIGVVTPGGDAPGMNTAIRAVVRTAIYNNLKIYGIERGWAGLAENRIVNMELQSVGGIINRGGTILHTHRCRKRSGKKRSTICAPIISKDWWSSAATARSGPRTN
jgi:6-phosphofructokinase